MFWVKGSSRLRYMSFLNSALSIFLRRLFNIKINSEGNAIYLREGGNFVISNHLSYFDGIIIGSLLPLIYVSKSEVISWPLFGWMSRVGGTVFVERGKPFLSQKYIKDIAGLLKEKINVLVFPEGTSTNGEQLRPFQSIFFQAPLAADSFVLPLTVSYEKIDREPVSASNRDKVFWYGQIKFAKHILGALRLKKIEARVMFHPRLKPSSVHRDISDRKHLSLLSRQTILETYPIIGKQ